MSLAREGRRVSLEDLTADLDSILDYIGLQLDELATSDRHQQSHARPPSFDGSFKSGQSRGEEAREEDAITVATIATSVEDDKEIDDVDGPTLVPFDRVDMVQVEAFLSLYLPATPSSPAVNSTRSRFPTSSSSLDLERGYDAPAHGGHFASSASLPYVSSHFGDDSGNFDVLEDSLAAPRLTLPARVQACIRFLRQERALASEGLFRKCGLKARVQQLHRTLPRDPPET